MNSQTLPIIKATLCWRNMSAARCECGQIRKVSESHITYLNGNQRDLSSGSFLRMEESQITYLESNVTGTKALQGIYWDQSFLWGS